ncbi:hypothetical protein CEK28_02780 [Xenophilus sp. AP218F]|nr:hypothetical protein CEK28_02780 [Xenophilus sp. AP218F]
MTWAVLILAGGWWALDALRAAVAGLWLAAQWLALLIALAAGLSDLLPDPHPWLPLLAALNWS